jgi:hypothetical protein
VPVNFYVRSGHHLFASFAELFLHWQFDWQKELDSVSVNAHASNLIPIDVAQRLAVPWREVRVILDPVSQISENPDCLVNLGSRAILGKCRVIHFKLDRHSHRAHSICPSSPASAKLK